MKKIIAMVLGVLVVLFIGVFLFFRFSGPKKEDYIYLQEPRIVVKADTTALMVKFDGLPDIVIREAFGKLFKVYYSLKGVKKGPGQPAPVARYENIFEVMKRAGSGDYKTVVWKGFTAIPLPPGVKELSEKARSEPYPAYIETLPYGTVAEIVHFGPYEKEKATIDKLLQHIKVQGYEVSGLHEEEYIRGPGVPFVKSADYITIIRYQVSKVSN
jgi:effector-binding domain-containing protein